LKNQPFLMMQGTDKRTGRLGNAIPGNNTKAPQITPQNTKNTQKNTRHPQNQNREEAQKRSPEEAQTPT
jgi:hypothetical protein